MSRSHPRIPLALAALGLAAAALAGCADPAGPPNGVVCVGLRCTCPASATLICNNTCTQNTRDNCGACGNACALGESCQDSPAVDGGVIYRCR
jgi:hypothetical protein